MAADRITTALIATTTPQLPHTREADSVPLRTGTMMDISTIGPKEF